ncbi:MAG TPA: recombinase RecA [bacterium]|nr:recombinase RecA [bacterium]
MIKKEKSLIKDAIDKINKVYGPGSIMKTNDTAIDGVEFVSTGIIGIDRNFGGGLPRGRIIEIYGPEASSKTTFCLQFAASIQKLGEEVAFIDTENTLDLDYAEHLGVDLDKMYLSQPGWGEQALEILDFLLDARLGLIVIDSVAALTPKSEIEGEMGDSKMGLQARLMSQAMRKITAKVNKSNTIVIFTNQLRSKIGIVYGSPETTTGGNALKFYSSIRIDVRSSGKILNTDQQIIGNIVKIKSAKNKVFPPFRTIEVSLIFGEGYSYLLDLLDLCVKEKIIEKSGSWFNYGETKLGQGRNNVIDLLKDNFELQEELKQKLIKNDK